VIETITTQQIMKKSMYFEKNQQLLLNFDADSESFIRFFPARLVPQIILKESSKNTQHALIEWLRKETTRYFTKTKVNVVSLVLSLVFKTVFGIFLTSLICLKSVK
jgi:hypothetical protein